MCVPKMARPYFITSDPQSVLDEQNSGVWGVGAGEGDCGRSIGICWRLPLMLSVDHRAAMPLPPPPNQMTALLPSRPWLSGIASHQLAGERQPAKRSPVKTEHCVAPEPPPLGCRMAGWPATYWRGGGGGAGGLGPKKVCVPKMARSDFPNGTFRCFPRRSLWSGGGGGGLLRWRTAIPILPCSPSPHGVTYLEATNTPLSVKRSALIFSMSGAAEVTRGSCRRCHAASQREASARGGGAQHHTDPGADGSKSGCRSGYGSLDVGGRGLAVTRRLVGRWGRTEADGVEWTGIRKQEGEGDPPPLFKRMLDHVSCRAVLKGGKRGS